MKYIFLIFLPLIIICFFSNNNVKAQWVLADTITNYKSTDYITTPNSIAIDNENTIHIVWQKKDVETNENSWRIYYAKKPANGNWSHPIPISDTLYRSGYASIAVNEKIQKIFITYVKVYDNFRSEIVLAIQNSNLSWQKINIVNDSLQNSQPTISIDNDNIVHITWLGMDSLYIHQIKYCNYNNKIWKVNTLEDNFFGDLYYATPSLSISPKGCINILYLNVINGKPRNVHAKICTDKWEYELLNESINAQGILKISKSGRFNYIYNFTKDFQFPFKVYYTYKDNEDWTEPELISNNFDGYCTSYDVDNNNKIHMMLDSLVWAFKAGTIYYATNKSGIWNISKVSQESNMYFSSFKLNKNGIGHVIASYEEYPNPTDLFHFESQDNLISINNNFTNYIDSYNLFQNYPNPFNSSTIIKFELPVSQFVEIKVFDNLGKLVSKLANKVFPYGINNVNFVSSDLPSGVYFYSINTKNFSTTKKLIILK
ncbi:MAG: T9SS type A sorting domain-containing protein [Ignavibacteria bacterium]|nr:T9SS type A sorting domain-containing protein [Ignavibacteria bacterium]